MTEAVIYVDLDTVVGINAEHGGPGAGVINADGVGAQLERARHTFMGVDLYPTVVEKAAAILHGLASTQYFHDGNKRTAWITTKLFLALNNHPLRDVSDIEAEAFVLAMAVSAFRADGEPDREVRKAAEWLQAQKFAGSDRLSLVTLAHQVVVRADGNYTVDIFGANLAGGLLQTFPNRLRMGALLQMRWHPHDVGRPRQLRIFQEPNPDAEVQFPTQEYVDLVRAAGPVDLPEAPGYTRPVEFVSVHAPVPLDHSILGPDYQPTTSLARNFWIRFFAPTAVWIRFELDEELVARISFQVEAEPAALDLDDIHDL